jgi:hypothetical protein
MASASFQIDRGTAIDTLAAGSQSITEGTAAPTTANNIEVRIDVAAGWTKNEIEQALDTIFRYILDVNRSTSIPL